MGAESTAKQLCSSIGTTRKKNDSVAEEVTVVGENTKHPDVVLYVNGIALGVIELKELVSL